MKAVPNEAIGSGCVVSETECFVSTLFIAGSPRSGTTALTDYLNRHPEILICRERYKFVPRTVRPHFFDFDRILDYTRKETNTSREYHARLLARKDLRAVRWRGDKYPHYVRHLDTLSENNPGAHFLFTYRDVGEVAESFEARAKDPDDRWPAENGFEAGVHMWNATLRSIREFVESNLDTNVLVLDYCEFFYRCEECLPLLSDFLGLEFEGAMRETWEKMSRNFEVRRRDKKLLGEKQLSFLARNKNHEDEAWILDYINKQKDARKTPPAVAVATRDTGSGTADFEGDTGKVGGREPDGMQSFRNNRQKSRNGVALESYDFVDFGASKGGSIDYALRKLGGTRGLGIDADPKKVEVMVEAGYDCVQADITRLELPSDSVKFVVMSHFLEHLSDVESVEKAIRSAAEVASDFLFIQGPYFDDDEFLASQGLKFYWSDWHGHKCHLTSSLLRRILLNLGLEDHVILGRSRVNDSFDSTIHPLDSPRDQHAYDPDIHSGKPFVTFRRSLYKEMVCFVRLGAPEVLREVLHAHRGCEPLEPRDSREPATESVLQEAPSTRLEPEPGKAASQSPGIATKGAPGGLDELERRLLLVRRWSYLRYVHLREGLLCARDIRSVLSVGCGRGFAELALALEFPDVRFHLTDVEGERTPHYQGAQRLADKLGLDNVTFGVRNVLEPGRKRYDLVASVEVLEHIENDALAAAEMRATANRYVFALVPFADAAAKRDENLRRKVYKSHEHFRVGYDIEDLTRMFPSVVAARGCYWRDRGGVFRQRLHEMSDEEVSASVHALREEARLDVVDEIPQVYPEAQGVWILSKV